MIDAVFFDYAGVLAEPSSHFIYNKLIKSGKSMTLEEFREAIVNDECSTGNFGTLDMVLTTRYSHLNIKVSEIFDIYTKSKRFEHSWDIARYLRDKNIRVGIISDQSAEAAMIIRALNTEITEIFNPILFSSEVKLPKRKKDIFELAKSMVGCNDNRVLMIDDREIVLRTVESAGFKGLLYNGPESLEDGLKKYGLILH